MLKVAPGFTHIKVLAPESKLRQPPRDVTPRALQSDSTPPSIRKSALHLVSIALDVACGVRPQNHLVRKRFDRQVSIHIASHLQRSRARGPVRLRSFHLAVMDNPVVAELMEIHLGAEVCGTYEVAGRTNAFAARLEQADGKSAWRMKTLRLY